MAHYRKQPLRPRRRQTWHEAHLIDGFSLGQTPEGELGFSVTCGECGTEGVFAFYDNDDAARFLVLFRKMLAEVHPEATPAPVRPSLN